MSNEASLGLGLARAMAALVARAPSESRRDPGTKPSTLARGPPASCDNLPSGSLDFLHRLVDVREVSVNRDSWLVSFHYRADSAARAARRIEQNVVHLGGVRELPS